MGHRAWRGVVSRCTCGSPGRARRHASARGRVPDDTPRQRDSVPRRVWTGTGQGTERETATATLARETGHTGSSGRYSWPTAGPRGQPSGPVEKVELADATRRARSLLPSVRPGHWRPKRRTVPDDHETLRAVRARAPAPVACVSPLHPGQAAGTRYVAVHSHHAT